MRQYLYISTAPGMPDAQVAEIVAQSERNNAARRITGFLAYNGANFLQVIEGERAALDELMAVLARDSRHSGIVKLEDVAIAERSFPSWRMRGFAATDPASLRRFSLATELPRQLDEAIRRVALNFASLN